MITQQEITSHLSAGTEIECSEEDYRNQTREDIKDVTIKLIQSNLVVTALIGLNEVIRLDQKIFGCRGYRYRKGRLEYIGK